MTDTRTFREVFCERYQLNPKQFTWMVIRRTMYPHAIPILWWCFVFRKTDYFAADVDLVRELGDLRRLHQFKDELEEYWHHPFNQGFRRRKLRWRISTELLGNLFRETMASPAEAD